MSRGERLALAAIVLCGAALRLIPVSYGLPFVFHADETFLILELGKFLGGIMHGNVPFGISTFHYPLTLLYAGYFGIGVFTGGVHSVADVQRAFLLDAPALHLIGRTLDALLSAATLVLTFAVGREIYSARVGLIAALLMAVCLPDISGAHWLKQNAIVTIMTLSSTLAIVKATRGGRSGIQPFALGGLLGLAVATRIDLAFVVPLFLIAIAVEPDGRASVPRLKMLSARRVVATVSVAVVVYLLVSFQLLHILTTYVMSQEPLFTTRTTGASLTQFLAAGDLMVTLRHNAWFYLTRGLINTGGLVLAVFVIAGSVKAIWSHRREELILVTLAGMMLVQLLAFNVYAIHYFGRFMPALMIFAASAIVGTASLAPVHARTWALMACVAVAAAQPMFYSLRYVQYVATNVDTRIRALDWIHGNVPFGTPIAVQKFDELPAYLPPLHESREFAAARLALIRADGRSSGLALQERLLSYPEDTYPITNLSVERRWAGAGVPLENNYQFDRLTSSGVRYVVMSSYNSPLMDEEAHVVGMLISPSALDQDTFARYADFMRQLPERATLVAEFLPRNSAVTRQTDSPIDPIIRIYRLQ